MTERTRRLFLKELEKKFSEDKHDDDLLPLLYSKYIMKDSGRPSERITPSLKAVEELWRKHPDMRLGQLIWWIAGRDPFYMEEDELIDNINRLFRLEGEHGD